MARTAITCAVLAVLATSAAAGAVQRPKQCVHGKPKALEPGRVHWTQNETLKARADGRVPHPLQHFSVDLDRPAGERWDNVTAAFRDKAHFIVDYLEGFIPPFLFPTFEKILAGVIGYKGFER